MPAPDIETLLDFETPIEKMFAHLFGSNDVVIYTPSNAAFVDDAAWQAANPTLLDKIFSSQDEFEKHRPRIEVHVNAGDATDHVKPDATTTKRSDARDGTIVVSVITEANILLSRAYCARARRIMNDDSSALEAIHMPYHEIKKCRELAPNYKYAPEEGLISVDLNYSAYIRIKDDAWPT